MRRFRLALSVLVVGACASGPSSPRPPAASPPLTRPAYPATRALASGSAAGPGSARDDEALATRFQTAPALETLEGEASYYSDALAGHPTASGELYRPLALTAAHRKLPLGTVLRVTRSDGTRVVYVRVNDRGPYGSKRRILDLSRAAAEALGMLRAGVLEVRAEVVAYGQKRGR